MGKMNKLEILISSTFLFFEVVCILKHPQFSLYLNFLLIKDILREKRGTQYIIPHVMLDELKRQHINCNISHSTLF